MRAADWRRLVADGEELGAEAGDFLADGDVDRLFGPNRHDDGALEVPISVRTPDGEEMAWDMAERVGGGG